MRRSDWTISIALLVLAPAIAAAGPAEDAGAVIDRWAAAYSANDREALVALYTPDAILLGTTSPVVSKGTEDIRKYFEALPGSGRKNAIGERDLVVLGPDVVLGTGFYTFARREQNDEPRPSRFTMVVVKRDGQWRIAHHHSSPRAAKRQ
ncbi:MAG: SgcJ/EcaC family oxidoreductase [Rhodospirillales bacterium]|nr:SgcJ/EcaC family oxidoreductase [Rhodospirillales bacterium]QQS11097.1 MAG: SgcJ/EcaC family oxidoreductase [Rhodospirillales bacterium]